MPGTLSGNRFIDGLGDSGKVKGGGENQREPNERYPISNRSPNPAGKSRSQSGARGSFSNLSKPIPARRIRNIEARQRNLAVPRNFAKPGIHWSNTWNSGV